MSSNEKFWEEELKPLEERWAENSTILSGRLYYKDVLKIFRTKDEVPYALFNIVVRKRNFIANTIRKYFIFVKAYGEQVVQKLEGMKSGDYIKVVGSLQSWDGKTHLQAYDIIPMDNPAEMERGNGAGTPESAVVTGHIRDIKERSIKNGAIISGGEENEFVLNPEEFKEDAHIDVDPDDIPGSFTDDDDIWNSDDPDDDDDDETFRPRQASNPVPSAPAPVPALAYPVPEKPVKIKKPKKKPKKSWRERLREH